MDVLLVLMVLNVAATVGLVWELAQFAKLQQRLVRRSGTHPERAEGKRCHPREAAVPTFADTTGRGAYL